MKKTLALALSSLFILWSSISFAETITKTIGVGLVLEKKSEKAFVIKDIIPNSPASRNAQIQIGDMITAIKSLPTSTWERVYGKSIEEVTLMIQGPVGIPVGLKIYHPADHAVVEVFLTREEIELP